VLIVADCYYKAYTERSVVFGSFCKLRGILGHKF